MISFKCFNFKKQIKFSRSIKSKYPKIKFEELEKYISEYKNRYYSRLVCTKEKPKYLLGHTGINLLLRLLQRSKYLSVGLIDCINRTHRAVSYLIVRAHFETTGSVAYFLKHLRRYYNKEIKYEEIYEITGRLFVGGRTFPDKKDRPYRPDAVNVLNQIEAADKIFKEMGGGEVKPFRDCYDFLSEFCHPNCLGQTIGSKIKGMTVEYYENPDFDEKDYVTLIYYMLISCRFLFYVYDECFTLLENNEEMPILFK